MEGVQEIFAVQAVHGVLFPEIVHEGAARLDGLGANGERRVYYYTEESCGIAAGFFIACRLSRRASTRFVLLAIVMRANLSGARALRKKLNNRLYIVWAESLALARGSRLNAAKRCRGC